MVVIGECLIVNHNTKYNLCSWGLEFDQFCIGNEGWMVVVDAWRELIWPFHIVKMYGKVVGGCLWILIVGDYKKFVLYKWVTLGTYHSSNNVWLTKAFLVSLAPISFLFLFLFSCKRIKSLVRHFEFDRCLWLIRG